MLQASTIDDLYDMIIDQAFDKLDSRECISRRQVLASVVLFPNVTVRCWHYLLDIMTYQAEVDLSPLRSVTHAPSSINGQVCFSCLIVKVIEC